MPNPIRIYSDNRGAILFEGRRAIEPKFVGTLIASEYSEGRIQIVRTDRFKADGVTPRVVFKRLKAIRVQNSQSQYLVGDLGYNTQEVIDYLNDEFNPTPTNVQSFNNADGVELDYKEDGTRPIVEVFIDENGNLHQSFPTFQYNDNTRKLLITFGGNFESGFVICS